MATSKAPATVPASKRRWARYAIDTHLGLTCNLKTLFEQAEGVLVNVTFPIRLLCPEQRFGIAIDLVWLGPKVFDQVDIGDALVLHCSFVVAVIHIFRS